MNTEAQRMRFENIDKAFSELKKNVRNSAVPSIISKELSAIFEQTFSVQVLLTKRSDPCYVMSVFPEQSTIDKIIDSIVAEESVNVIYELWKKNTSWIIEIDRKVLDDSIVPISSRECTALLLHEIGHVVNSAAIPNRINRVLKYEFAKAGSVFKSVVKNPHFRNVLSLPVLDAFSMSSNISQGNLKEEIEADLFVKKMGYKDELTSALEKFISKSTTTPDAAMKKSFQMSEVIINNFVQRKAALSQNMMQRLLSRIPSPFIRGKFSVPGMIRESASINTRMEFLTEKACDIADSYYAEFFFSKKKLKKLPAYDLDYIQVEIDKIQSNDGKLLMLSYIRNKLDTVQYYIDILMSDKYAKKYNVPHSMEYLQSYKQGLLRLLDMCMDKRIVPKTYSVWQPQYPEGYEG